MSKQIPELTIITTPTAGQESIIETVVARHDTYATSRMTLAQIFTLGSISGSIKVALDALGTLIATNTASIALKLNTSGGTRTGLTANRAIYTNGSGVESFLTGGTTEFIGFDGSGMPISKVPDSRIAGELRIWSTNTAPTGWFICDGTAINRTTYATLFGVIGTTFGPGDGSTTFNIPNLKGMVVVGRDAGQTEFDVIGETGGAKTHTLTVNEMPSHSHSLTVYNIGGATPGIYPTNQNTAGAYTTVNTNNQGSNQAHNNLQPYMVMNYIIAT